MRTPIFAVLAVFSVCSCDPGSGSIEGPTGTAVTSSSGLGQGGAGGSGVGAGGGLTGTGGSGASLSGTIVPLYSYPTDPGWNVVATTQQMHPMVPVLAIINPDSGPGMAEDANFTTGIAALGAAGVTVLGYVATTYGNKTVNAVHAEIDAYHTFYPDVEGIFFDEMRNDAGGEPYYAELTQYAKSQGFMMTVGNPGADTLPGYIGTVDTMFIYETDGLPDVGTLGGWYTQYDKLNFGIIPYAVPALDAGFVAAAIPLVGYIYLTDDDLPNPWDSIPTYFPDLVAALEMGSN